MGFLSMPNIMLIASVLVTCIGCTLVAVFLLDISGWSVLWIWLMNIGSLICVDVGKIYFRRAIGDAPGEIIVSDELIEYVPQSDVKQHEEKKKRYSVHRESILDPTDFEPVRVEVGGMFNVRNYGGEITFTQPGARMKPLTGGVGPRSKTA